jgi:hypothetical protein
VLVIHPSPDIRLARRLRYVINLLLSAAYGRSMKSKL